VTDTPNKTCTLYTA